MIEKVPNILSVSRIVSAPVMLIVSLYGLSDVFLVIFVLAFITDGLDGLIARRFNCESKMGGRLDTWGDFSLFSVLPFCIYLLWPNIVYEELLFIVIAGISIITPVILGLIKFKRMISFHTYLSKVSLFLISISVFLLIVIDVNVFFRISVFFMVLSGVEMVLIELLLNKYQNNIPSIFFVIKNNCKN